jgi:hypothetical protein
MARTGLLVAVLLALVATPTGSAATIIDYTTAAVVNNPDNVVVTTSDGVVITAHGYHVDFIDASTAAVYGPFPTTPGDRGFQVFGVETRGVQEGLGLLAQPIGSLTPSEDDVGTANFQPGFDNQTLQGSFDTIQFALFVFSESVDVSQLILGTPGIVGDAWVAGGSGAVPDLTTDLLGALTTLGVQTHVDRVSGTQLMHDLVGLNNVDFLLVGTTPFDTDYGPLTNDGRSQFFIDGFNLAPVPEPALAWLLLPALVALRRLGR